MTMTKIYYLLGLCICFIACDNAGTSEEETPDDTVPETTTLFKPVENTFDNQRLVVPEGAQVDILFTETLDSVLRADGQKFPAKGKHDYVEYIPIDGSSEHGYMFVNHESRNANADLGDGGGMSWFEIKRESGTWTVVGEFHHIDFSHLGGTYHNCGGTRTPHGTIITAEEYPPFSNAELYGEGKDITDTSDFEGMKRYEAMGWMVEIDPVTKKAVRKLYSMGRYSHEDAHCMPDGRTVYLTDDFGPAVFFKFVADQAGDYTTGQLYAYQQSEDGESGTWLLLPMDRDSLIDARLVAIRNGATMFVRMEWIDFANGKIYITETGSDNIDYSPFVKMGGRIANYLTVNEGGIVDDPHGRVLEFDPATEKMRVYLEGGAIPNGGADAYFSSPDGLGVGTIGGKEYLVICEDIISRSRNRVPAHVEAKNETYNEMFFLDATIENPSLDDLQRFSVGPRGCEQTGPVFTPDHSTLFFSVQSPSSENTPPYDRTSVVAVTGIFEK